MKRPRRTKAKPAVVPATPAALFHPDPHALLMEAEEEIGRGDLKSYARVIATLRKKGFSFREIAEWLNARGVPTDHNAVYRVFTTCLDQGEVDAIEEGLQDV